MQICQYFIACEILKHPQKPVHFISTWTKWLITVTHFTYIVFNKPCTCSTINSLMSIKSSTPPAQLMRF